MELWEGAILVVGGIFLVGYMSQKNQAAMLAAQQAGAASTTVQPNVGTTNTSNLTDITNQAGGQPTVWGEPLEPPQAPLIPGGVVGPATTSGGRNPLPVAPIRSWGGTPAPRVPIIPTIPTSPRMPAALNAMGPLPVRGTIARPIDQHLL